MLDFLKIMEDEIAERLEKRDSTWSEEDAETIRSARERLAQGMEARIQVKT